MENRNNVLTTVLEIVDSIEDVKSTYRSLVEEIEEKENARRSLLEAFEKLKDIDSQINRFEPLYRKRRRFRRIEEERVWKLESEDNNDSISFCADVSYLADLFKVHITLLDNPSNKTDQDFREFLITANTVRKLVKIMGPRYSMYENEDMQKLWMSFGDDWIRDGQSFSELESAMNDFRRDKMESFNSSFISGMEKLAPASFVEEITMLSDVGAINDITPNGRNSNYKDISYIGYIYCPYIIEDNSVLAEYLEEKFSNIIDGEFIVFPLPFFVGDNTKVRLEGIHNEGKANAIQSIIMNYLANTPIGKCSINIIDPQGQLRESSYIQVISQCIKGTLEIHDDEKKIRKFIAQHDEREDRAELLVVLGTFESLNINQSNWLYKTIGHDWQAESCMIVIGDPTAKSVHELTMDCEESDVFYKGLRALFSDPMTEKEISVFIDNYLLLYDPDGNNITSSTVVKRLFESETKEEIIASTQQIKRLNDLYDSEIVSPLSDIRNFPNEVILGKAFYPAALAKKSEYQKQILQLFGADDDLGRAKYLSLPFVHEMGKSFNLVIHQSKENKRDVIRATQSFLYRYLAGIPVTLLNVSVFDPVGRGGSLQPFLEFKKKSDVFDSEIYTTNAQITQKLKDLTNYIDSFIQEKLGSSYSDFHDYNLHNLQKPETVKLLIMYDFPTKMTSECLDLLQNIVRYAGKCGIVVIFCHDRDAQFDVDYHIEELKKQVNDLIQNSTEIDYVNGMLQVKQKNLLLDVGTLPKEELLTKFFELYSGSSEVINNQGLSFTDIIAEQKFALDSGKRLAIPIGIGDGNKVINLDLGNDSSHHGLIVGATGSGKSTLLHTIIMSGMLNYRPDQLQFYLMDFKSGTEFKIYESFRLPHIRLLALDAMQEFGESILESIVEEMEHRSSLFKNAGQTSLHGYKEATGKEMPRLLVLMDEFQVLFNDSSNRKVAMHCAELTKRIVTEGRAFGVNLIMATQSTRVISDLSLSSGIIEQMRVRIGLKCGETDARYMFSDANDRQALEMMKGPIGTAVINLDYTEKNNQGFRVAYCDLDEQQRALELISNEFSMEPCQLQVFEGQRSPVLIDYLKQMDPSLVNNLKKTVTAYLGEPIKVAEPISITMSKRNRHNLLICGANERMESILVKDFVITAMMSQCIDLYYMDGGILVDDFDMDDYLRSAYSNENNIHLAQGRADIISYINTLYETYQKQKKTGSRINTVVLINNLQYIDVIQAMLRGDQVDESEYLDIGENLLDIQGVENPFDQIDDYEINGSPEKTIGEKLIQMIENGYAYGIHFVIASADYQVVKECLQNWNGPVLDRFPERIIFSLDNTAADNLIPDISVEGMSENIVVYTDGIKRKYQMKPFMPPDEEELIHYLNGYTSVGN